MRLALYAATLLAGALMVVGCAKPTPPKGVEPVTGFEADRYLGTWYEIARLDHRFERGLTHVSATYSRPEEDGPIKVLNRGWDVEDEEWDVAEGKARFIGDESTGALSVTFFWPFSGGYFVMDLDKENYQWVLVSGPDTKYLWILARERTLDQAIVDRLIAKAKDAGFPTQELIMVKQLPPID